MADPSCRSCCCCSHLLRQDRNTDNQHDECGELKALSSLHYIAEVPRPRTPAHTCIGIALLCSAVAQLMLVPHDSCLPSGALCPPQVHLALLLAASCGAARASVAQLRWLNALPDSPCRRCCPLNRRCGWRLWRAPRATCLSTRSRVCFMHLLILIG